MSPAAGRKRAGSSPDPPGVGRGTGRTRPWVCTFGAAPLRSPQGMKTPRARSGRAYLLSRESLMAMSDFLREEAERSTATFRTIDPLKPVRPACSEPMAIMR